MAPYLSSNAEPAGATSAPAPLPEPPSTEREEAFWCEIVLLRYRLKAREREILQQQELIGLQREKIASLERQAATVQVTSTEPPMTAEARAPRGGKRLTPEQLGQLLDQLRSGTSAQTIARQYGITPSYVYQVRTRYRIPKGGSPQ